MENKSTEQLGELFAALSKAQGILQTAVKDTANPYFKSKYSTLDSCWEACRQPLSKNGLSIIQVIEEKEGKYFIRTILGHSSGQYISSVMPIIMAKQDAQSMGSAISYMRRYSLCALVGITSGDDDDGEKAMSRNQKQPQEDHEYIPSTISLEDAYTIDRDIQLLITPLDPEYKKRALGVLKIDSFEKLPADQLDRVKANIAKKIEDLRKKEAIIDDDQKVPF